VHLWLEAQPEKAEGSHQTKGLFWRRIEVSTPVRIEELRRRDFGNPLRMDERQT
jgi:hypothetical protein